MAPTPRTGQRNAGRNRKKPARRLRLTCRLQNPPAITTGRLMRRTRCRAPSGSASASRTVIGLFTRSTPRRPRRPWFWWCQSCSARHGRYAMPVTIESACPTTSFTRRARKSERCPQSCCRMKIRTRKAPSGNVTRKRAGDASSARASSIHAATIANVRAISRTARPSLALANALVARSSSRASPSGGGGRVLGGALRGRRAKPARSNAKRGAPECPDLYEFGPRTVNLARAASTLSPSACPRSHG